MPRQLRWLEVSADFHCNNRCLGCFSVGGENEPAMSSADIVTELRRGRARGATALWLGGGEPTLRRDLAAVVKKARELGYERIKLQTNGMLLAYPEVTARLVAAGVSEVNFAIKGATADTHDRLTRTPGCHELMLKGMVNVAASGLPMAGDILVYRSNLHELVDMVRDYFGRGVTHFNVWAFSASDQGDRDLTAQIPRLTDVAREVTRAMDAGICSDADFITSLHTPPCVVPRSHWACLFHGEALDLWVANPGGYGFFLEASPIEGGHYPANCATCAARSHCGGARRDYLEVFGDDELRALAECPPSPREIPREPRI